MKKVINYFTPALLAIIMFLSNFLSADIFHAGFQSFSVWFVLSVFAFACGWFVDKTLDWKFGGKILFAIIVGTTAIGLFLIIFFNQYFGVNEILPENLVLYSLRNITLGSIGFFGMAVAEVTILQRELAMFQNTKETNVDERELAKKEAHLILNKAKVDADKMLFEAEKQLNEITTKKNRVESQLREFVRVEREIIKKYEQDPDYK